MDVAMEIVSIHIVPIIDGNPRRDLELHVSDPRYFESTLTHLFEQEFSLEITFKHPKGETVICAKSMDDFSIEIEVVPC
jgi:hypothetical protein